MFKKKPITPCKRVCLRLKEAREKSFTSLYELAKLTKISKKHLRALEECRFDDIPYAVIYQKNFIKKYAESLHLPIADILNQFIVEEAGTKSPPNPIAKKIERGKLQNLPFLLRLSFFSLAVFLLVGFLGWQVKSLLAPPELLVYSPPNGLVTYDRELTIQGETSSQTQIHINGKEVANTDDGRFKETLNLSVGITPTRLSAHKKHGQATEIVRYVILKNDSQLSYKSRRVHNK